MPFRARMKAAFTRRSSDSSSSNASSSNSLHQVQSRGLGDPKIYQPGEQMPRPKYRAPVDKKHKEKLEAFDFGSAWRPRSGSVASGCSPTASRAPSRRTSVSSPALSGWASVAQALDSESSSPGLLDGKKAASLADMHQEFVPTSEISIRATASPMRSAPFTQREFDSALERSEAGIPLAVS